MKVLIFLLRMVRLMVYVLIARMGIMEILKGNNSLGIIILLLVFTLAFLVESRSIINSRKDIKEQLGKTKENGSITSQLGNTKENGSITSQLGNTKENGSITSQLGNTKENGSITSQLGNHLGNTADNGSITSQIGRSTDKVLEKIASVENGSLSYKIDNNAVILGELKHKEEERLSLLYSVKSNVGDSLIHLEQVITQYKQIYKELIEANKKIISLESELRDANKKIELLSAEKENSRDMSYDTYDKEDEIEL